MVADEPTGTLDTASSDEVFVQLRRMHAELGVTFIVITHDARLGARGDRLIEWVDGKIARNEPVNPSAPFDPSASSRQASATRTVL